MTLPGGIENVNIPDGLPELLFPMSPPTVGTQHLSRGYDLTEENVRDGLKQEKVLNNPGINIPLAAVSTGLGLRPGIPLMHALLEKLAQRLLGVTTEWATLEGVVQAVGEVPFWGTLAEILTGIEDGNKEDIGTWVNNLMASLQMSAEQVAATLQKLFIIGDVIEVLRQHEDGDPDDLGSWFNARINDIRSLVINIVTGLTGMSGTDWLHGDAQQALRDEAATVAALSAALADLQNRQTNRGFSGNSAVFSFADQPDSTGLPAAFTQTYTGSGTGRWGVKDGKATWYPANDNNRYSQGIYNLAQSATDYQLIGASFASIPDWFSWSAYSTNAIYGRCNAAGTTRIYVEFNRFTFDLGCVVNGARTKFVGVGHTFRANSTYWLECGTDGGVRVFRVLDSNFVPLVTHTEVGATSQVGSSFRQVGAAVDVSASWLGTNEPGRLSALGFADNTPAPTLGSYARVFRASTSNSASTANGERIIAGNVFDTVDRITPDIAFDAATNKFTVSRTDTYAFQFRFDSGSLSVQQSCHPIVYMNGAVAARGDEKWLPNASGVVGFGGYTHVVYMEAGDYIQPGFATGTSSYTIVGDATGTKTFMTLSPLRNREENGL